jgi:hypothetical protein
MKRAAFLAVGLVVSASSFTLVGCIDDASSDESLLEGEIYRGQGSDRGRKCGWWKHGHHGRGGAGGSGGGTAGATGMGGTTGAAGTTGNAGTTGTGGTGPQCPLPPPNVVSWWHLDGNYQDANGSNHGTASGNTMFGAGLRGSAVALDGSTGTYIEVPDAQNLRIAGAITLDAWIRPTAPDGRIVDKIHAFSTSGYTLDLVGDQLRIIAGGDLLVSAPGTIPMGEWSHVAGIFSGSSLALYVDGALVASKSTAGDPTPIAEIPMRMGADSTGGSPFRGMIDEPRIFDRALSSAEIATLHQQGTAPPCP